MKTMVNLLPPAFRKQQMIRKRAIQWSSVVALGLVLGWAAHWYELRENVALSQELDLLTREHRPTQTMLRQLGEMRQQLEELQQQEAVARELENQRNALALLGVISQSAQRTKGRLRVIDLKLTDFQSTGRSNAGSTPSGQAGALVLSGVSLDNQAVVELLDGLEDSGMFSDVKLESSKEREGNNGPLRDYEVRCEF